MCCKYKIYIERSFLIITIENGLSCLCHNRHFHIYLLCLSSFSLIENISKQKIAINQQ